MSVYSKESGEIAFEENSIHKDVSLVPVRSRLHNICCG
jgi:hypothetical protein